MGLRACALHEAGNWLILTDCSDAFNAANRKAVLVEMAICVPALKPFKAKYSDEGTTGGIPSNGLGGASGSNVLLNGDAFLIVALRAEAFP